MSVLPDDGSRDIVRSVVLEMIKNMVILQKGVITVFCRLVFQRLWYFLYEELEGISLFSERHAHTHTQIRTHSRVRTHTRTHAHTYVCAYIYICINARTRARASRHTQARTQARARAHTHTRTHAHCVPYCRSVTGHCSIVRDTSVSLCMRWGLLGLG